MEPTMAASWDKVFLIVVVPFLSYFFGIVVRKVVFPGNSSLSWLRQFLLGVPVSLVVVPPLIPVLEATKANLAGFLVTVGILMEQGMLLNETATNHLNNLLRGNRNNEP